MLLNNTFLVKFKYEETTGNPI